MPTFAVNFSAPPAVAAALFALSCSPANSGSRAGDGTPVITASQQTQRAAAAAPDPTVAAADRGRTSGDSSAKTWVVIASDFQCPYCKQWHDETYRAFLDEYVRTGKVKVAYINYPLGQHQHALVTAEGAMCAGAQNRFWQYHDALFATQARWSVMSDARPVLDSIAKAVGVELPAWKGCVDAGTTRALIRADRDRATAAGVQSTPSFIIGDQVLAGTHTLESLRPAVDAAISKTAGSGR